MNTLKKLLLILCLVLCTTLLCSCSSTVEMAEIRGVWLWGATVRQQGAEKIAAKLKENKINTVFLLVKGQSGVAEYPSRVALEKVSDRDVLKEAIDAFKPQKISLHAWIVFHADQKWVAAHPEDALYHAGNPAEGKPDPYPVESRVCPFPQPTGNI